MPENNSKNNINLNLHDCNYLDLDVLQKIREIGMKRKRNDNLIIITDNRVTLFLHDSTLSRKLLSIEIFSSIVN